MNQEQTNKNQLDITKCHETILDLSNQLQQAYRNLATAHLKLENDEYAIVALQKISNLKQILNGKL